MAYVYICALASSSFLGERSFLIQHFMYSSPFTVYVLADLLARLLCGRPVVVVCIVFFRCIFVVVGLLSS